MYMNNDLKIIKKKYGERMMHLCRELFNTILDNNPGMLSGILLENFFPSHYLYDDIKDSHLENKFKDYIYSIYDKFRISDSNIISTVDDPKTLMKQVGYTLYECLTEQDIMAFKKYYAPGELLCTFKGNRLNRSYVYFAVHRDANKLNRQDFSCPRRQDAYGTSVISIQFTRDDSHTLSIKNRYNHTVSNPDATFSNDLENIIPGLTKSFANYYGMIQSHYNNLFEMPGYVKASDGKYYKYNYEINNVYYCPNNIIIDNFQVERYPRELYLIMDYFILDLVNKKFIFKKRSYDSFTDSIGVIKNINIVNNYDEKIVTITPQVGEDIIIVLDKYHRIISLKNNNVLEIYNNFLWHNTVLRDISLDNVLKIGDGFLFNNETATTISLPNVLKIGESFMCRSILTNVSLPKVTDIGYRFMTSNYYLRTLELPSLLIAGGNFLARNEVLEHILLPKVLRIGANFLEHNKCLKTISLPQVKDIYSGFCYRNEILNEVYLPRVEFIMANFLYLNDALKKIELPQVLSIGTNFMASNTVIETVRLPLVRIIPDNALQINESICEFYAPLLESSLQNRKLRNLQRKNTRKSLIQSKMKFFRYGSK